MIALGWPAIPLILSRLMTEPDHWFEALYEITGYDPVPEEAYGNMLAMADAWLRWGREHGQI